jgi:hypothetical protein
MVGHPLQMSDLPTRVRTACAAVAEQARSVTIVDRLIPEYAASLPLDHSVASAAVPRIPATQLTAYTLTLDAINFGSGWFPTLRKRDGRSGYRTVELGIMERFVEHGPWTPAELATLDAAEIAATLHQDPDHELMALFARSLNDLGRHVLADGGFDATVAAADGSAVALAERLATWDCFDDVSTYGGRPVPFYKRGQIAAADLARVGAPITRDLNRLTMFADNLVPHVLRLDGVLEFDTELVARIEREQLIEHGSPEEVEIRACAVHAVELIVAARPGATAARVDDVLWSRGAGARYKARPRHRSRCRAY